MSRNIIEPRMLPVSDALYYVGFSSSTFSKMRRELEDRLNFPKPHPINKKYDKKLLDKWLDDTGGIQPQGDALEAELIERARNGEF